MLKVSVETLGCKQPVPVCPSWDGEVRKPRSGELCVREFVCVRPSILKLDLQQLQIRREEASGGN